jgi:hypothetical protein
MMVMQSQWMKVMSSQMLFSGYLCMVLMVSFKFMKNLPVYAVDRHCNCNRLFLKVRNKYVSRKLGWKKLTNVTTVVVKTCISLRLE